MPNFYTQKDLESIKNLVEECGLKKVYITGYINVGKSTFCTEFNSRLTDYKHINIDDIKRDVDMGKNRDEALSEALSRTINENKCNSYILEYYDLLDVKPDRNTLKAWGREADILILLNPKREEGENVVYDNVSLVIKKKFEKLNGEIIYCNPSTGTYVKRMNKKDKFNKQSPTREGQSLPHFNPKQLFNGLPGESSRPEW